MEWLLGVVGGALGGWGAGAGVKQNKLGGIVNAVLGAIGGAGGSALVQNFMAGGAGLDLGAIAGNLVGGGVAAHVAVAAVLAAHVHRGLGRAALADHRQQGQRRRRAVL
ncbi:MAG TPA: hypothetical protein PK890_11540, partial [Terrimesophilobacter sp.]|nr:hypothetical protein [Terrimesophilobacter sp.]